MNMMNRYIIISLTAIFLFSLSPVCNAQVSLDGLLKPYLSRYDLPAIAAAVVKNGKIIAAGAVGTRRTGVNIPVTIHDRFHLGSDTKAMTALLLAMQIERSYSGAAQAI